MQNYSFYKKLMKSTNKKAALAVVLQKTANVLAALFSQVAEAYQLKAIEIRIEFTWFNLERSNSTPDQKPVILGSETTFLKIEKIEEHEAIK